MKPVQLESTLVGVAGEYFVAAELSLRGYLASVTLRNSRGIDIIASNADASKTVSIQVKTSGKPNWILNKKSETFVADNHFYIFVALHSMGQRPDFYIVPSCDIAEYTSRTHTEWLAGTKKDGTERKDSNMRVFRDDEHKYKEQWGNMGL